MASSWHKWTATHISTLFSKEDQDWFLAPNQDQDQPTNRKEEEEHDHREYWLRRRTNKIYNIMLFRFNYIVINLPLLDTNPV